ITDASVALDPAITARTVSLPILATASEGVGKKVVANIVALGVLAGLSGIVSREPLRQAVKARVPKGTDELNLKALDAGLQLAARTGVPGSTVR
ncbi:MAG: 2-oxoglutarate ferredoxin oxidoreductase subunit gamma, partial [Spirochaetes bacterium]